MSPRQIEILFNELCVDLGFCLPLEARIRLQENPETDIDAFTDAVIRAEGLDPYAGIELSVRRKVRAKVVDHFRAAESDGLNELLSQDGSNSEPPQ